MLVVLLAMQAAPVTGERTVYPDNDLNRFDLAKAKPKAADTACGVDNPGGDIVVCSRRKMMDVDTSRMPDFSESRSARWSTCPAAPKPVSARRRAMSAASRRKPSWPR
jgi:hypothetical protein